MTIESDVIDLLDDGRVRPALAIAECLPQHKAASVFATVSSMAGKSALVKVPGKGFTLPRHAPADAVGPDWAAPNIAPFTRVLLYVRRHQPVKRSTVARVLKNHVADVGRVITECIGIGHVHQIGDMLREGEDPRRAKVMGESSTGSALSASEVETAAVVDGGENVLLADAIQKIDELFANGEMGAAEQREARNGIDVGLVNDAVMKRAALLFGSDYDAGVLEPMPQTGEPDEVAAKAQAMQAALNSLEKVVEPFDAEGLVRWCDECATALLTSEMDNDGRCLKCGHEPRVTPWSGISTKAILDDSHAIDQEPAMPDVPDDAIPLMRTGNRKARDTSQDERHAQGMADVEFDYLHNGLRIVIAGPRDRALSFINHLLLKMRF